MSCLEGIIPSLFLTLVHPIFINETIITIIVKKSANKRGSYYKPMRGPYYKSNEIRKRDIRIPLQTARWEHDSLVLWKVPHSTFSFPFHVMSLHTHCGMETARNQCTWSALPEEIEPGFSELDTSKMPVL